MREAVTQRPCSTLQRTTILYGLGNFRSISNTSFLIFDTTTRFSVLGYTILPLALTPILKSESGLNLLTRPVKQKCGSTLR